MLFEKQKWKQASSVPDRLLRLAGQSLREEYDRLLDERFAASFAIVVAVWLVCIVAWIQKIAVTLDRTRARGFVAFHDLSENGFNIDHVVVGPFGVYAIETKTRRGSGRIDYQDDSNLLLGGRINDGPTLRQARGVARAMHDRLKEHLHRPYWVTPLLVLVGDWRVHRPAGDFAVDVITADQVEDYFDRQQPELTSEEIALICSDLERCARS